MPNTKPFTPATSTPAVNAMIAEWLGGDYSAESVERTARYMARTLHVGSIRICRGFVLSAIIATLEKELVMREAAAAHLAGIQASQNASSCAVLYDRLSDFNIQLMEA